MESRLSVSAADPGCLYRIRIFSIPNPKFKYFNPQKNVFSSRKYDPGCSSRILDADFLPIPNPRSRGQKGTGTWIGSAKLNKYEKALFF